MKRCHRLLVLVLCATLASSAAVAALRAPALADAAAPYTNADIVKFAQAGVAPATLVTIVKVHKPGYDLSPQGLAALKKAGVVDIVVQAMVEAQARDAAPPSAPAPAPAATAPDPLGPGATGRAQGPMPQVWLVNGTSKQPLAMLTAQVTDSKQTGGGMSGGGMAGAMGGAAMSAVSMGASMALGPLGGLASGALGMFAPRPKMTAPEVHQTLAIPGQHASMVLRDGSPTFELSYANIPGVDPEAYQPAIIRLMPTKDNWRITGTTTQSIGGAAGLGAMMVARGMPMPGMAAGGGAGPGASHPAIQDDRVAGATIEALGPGQARISFPQPLAPGEYAIVLRAVKKADGNDGLGGSGSIDMTSSLWDFAVTAQQSADPPQQAGSPVPAATSMR